LHTNHAGTDFYRKSPKKQELFMRSIVDTVSEVLPSPETNDRLLIHDAKTRILLVKDSSLESLVYLTPRKKKQPLRLSGEVVGVTLPDVMANGYGLHYKSPEDFATSDHGLGLLIEPHSINISLDTFEDPTFLLPLRSIKKLKLSLD
jgi:hypothetical protein